MPPPFDCWLLLRSLQTLAYRVRTHAAHALAVAARLRLVTHATSLGGPENLLRLSVGLEHPDDVIADLWQALDAARRHTLTGPA